MFDKRELRVGTDCSRMLGPLSHVPRIVVVFCLEAVTERVEGGAGVHSVFIAGLLFQGRMVIIRGVHMVRAAAVLALGEHIYRAEKVALQLLLVCRVGHLQLKGIVKGCHAGGSLDLDGPWGFFLDLFTLILVFIHQSNTTVCYIVY